MLKSKPSSLYRVDEDEVAVGNGGGGGAVAPTEAQMKLAIAQTLSMGFAYNAPVVVLKFDVAENGNITGVFKDAARPRVFSFTLDGESVAYKPYKPGKMDSLESEEDVQEWEAFSEGYSFRVDAGIGTGKKPQCVKPTAYNCGKACINIKNNCKSSPEDSNSQERLEKLKAVGKDYAKTTKSTKEPKTSEITKTDPKTKTEKLTEKQTQEKTKTLSIAQVEGLAKKAGVDVSKLEETAKKAGATEAQLLTIKNGVANYIKAQKTTDPSNVKPTKKKVSKPKAETKKPEPEAKKPEPVTNEQRTNLIGDGTHESTPKDAQEYYEMARKNGVEITEGEARETVKYVKSWVYNSEAIRNSQKQGRPNIGANLVSKYIANSVPYKGEIQRGMNFDSEDEAMNWLKGDKDGILDNQGAHASWTSDPKVAERFASFRGSGDSGQRVVIKAINKTGASIANLSPPTHKLSEVVVPKDARHKVKNITKKDGTIYVEVEEIDPLPEKGIAKQKKGSKSSEETTAKPEIEVKEPEKTTKPAKTELQPSVMSKADQLKVGTE